MAGKGKGPGWTTEEVMKLADRITHQGYGKTTNKALGEAYAANKNQFVKFDVREKDGTYYIRRAKPTGKPIK